MGCDCGGDRSGGAYIWVANTNESTVSKIDTVTMEEEGRYSTRPISGGSPSRTSVSITGDAVVVANRSGGVTKIWADPDSCDPARNGEPGLQTSSGAEALTFVAEDCIAWYHPSNHTTQRPIAWTSGTQDPVTCEYSGQAVWTSGCDPLVDSLVWVHLLDGETGVSLADLMVPGFPCAIFGAYGGAVDSNNDFWISNNSTSPLIARIRRSDLSTEVFYAPHHAYGITVDSLDRVWLTINNVSADAVAAQRFDPSTGIWDVALGTPLKGYSGIQEGPDGRMWLNYVSGSSTGLTWIDRETMEVGSPIDVPGAIGWLNGISIDPAGRVWTVSPNADTAFRYDPDTEVIDSYDGLDHPYTYSDMTGSGLLNSACGSPVG